MAKPGALVRTSLLACALTLPGCGRTGSAARVPADSAARADGGALCSKDCGEAGGAGGDSDDTVPSIDCGPPPEHPTLEPLVDPDPDWIRAGPVLELTRLAVAGIRVADPEPLVAGATVRVAVQTKLLDDCWLLGPLRVNSTGEPGVVVVEQLAFRERGGECTGDERQETRVLELTAPAGCLWLMDGAGEVRTTITVAPAEACAEPKHSTPTGSPCQRDCECRSPDHCLAVAAGLRVCGVACVLDSDCPAGSCVLDGVLGVGTCQPHAEDQCLNGADCAVGEACREWDGVLSCHPDGRLTSSDRHECASDDDCAFPGTRCVLMPRSDGTRGRCDVPCATDSTVCPPAHSCLPMIGRAPVCDWVGE